MMTNNVKLGEFERMVLVAVVSKGKRFNEKKASVSAMELLQLIGSSANGSNYQRVQNALARLNAVGLIDVDLTIPQPWVVNVAASAAPFFAM